MKALACFAILLALLVFLISRHGGAQLRRAECEQSVRSHECVRGADGQFTPVR